MSSLTKKDKNYIRKSFADGHGLHHEEVQRLFDHIDALEVALSAQPQAAPPAEAREFAEKLRDLPCSKDVWAVETERRIAARGSLLFVLAIQKAVSKTHMELLCLKSDEATTAKRH
jgi:hypothetical protein